MPLQKVGINFEGLGNITAPEFDIKNTSTEFLADIPVKANQVTNNYYGLGVLLGLFSFLVWKLADLTEFGDFRYSNLRATGISAGICSVLGMLGLNLGYFSNYYHIVIFMSITILLTIWVWKEEN